MYYLLINIIIFTIQEVVESAPTNYYSRNRKVSQGC